MTIIIIQCSCSRGRKSERLHRFNDACFSITHKIISLFIQKFSFSSIFHTFPSFASKQDKKKKYFSWRIWVGFHPKKRVGAEIKLIGSKKVFLLLSLCFAFLLHAQIHSIVAHRWMKKVKSDKAKQTKNHKIEKKTKN